MSSSPNHVAGMADVEIDIMRTVEDDLWWYRALRAHVLMSLHPARSDFALLDAGCGSGGMLARLHERFPHAHLTGLDYSARALELTSQRQTGATLLEGSADALPFADAQFDFVLSLDVLIVGGVDEAAALREMHRVLRPGGLLLLNLPAFDFLRGSHDVAVNISHRFTRPDLTGLLLASGFRLEHATYWNMTMLPAIAAIRWISRKNAHQPAVRSDLRPVWPPLNRSLAMLTQFELRLSRHLSLPFGTSLFATARK
ncbi:MAG: class I SAM-dependent methyltransferase [Chthoniobacterales bacterium]